MNYGKKGTERKQKQLTSKTPKIKKKFGVTFLKFFLICFLAICIIGFFAGFGLIKGIIDSAPDISNVDVSPSGYSTAVYDNEGNEITKLVSSDSNRIYVTMDKIPKHLQYAIVAIEDERFYEHNGIDIKGILRAGIGVITDNYSGGGSTITQQLLKNNVFSNWTEEKTFTEKLKRKIQEQYLAVQLEKQMSKDEILENYLNTINLGQNTLGVQAASLRYFNKKVSELSISESAVIAAITSNPTKYNPLRFPENNRDRRKIVLNNMLEQGYISQDEYDEAMADDVYARIQNVNEEISTSSVYSSFIDELTEQVMNDLQEQKGYSYTQAYNALYSGGLSIFTTQDSAIQKICDEEFANEDNYPKDVKYYLNYDLSVQKSDGSTVNHSTQMLESHFKESDKSFNLLFDSEDEAQACVEQYKQEVLSTTDTIIGENVNLTVQPQASMVVMDQSTGEVKAIEGGRGTKAASLTLNRATNTTRQPGSTFKVVSTYAPALDNAGLTLATVQDDAPFTYEDGRPVANWYGEAYKGLCTLRYGIEQSLNIVAVKTLTDITPQLGFDYLLNFGFSTLVSKRVGDDGKTYSDITQSLALGGLTDGVTNLELTAAYATIANGGTYIKPIFYTKIVDHNGDILIDNTPQTRTVIKETTSFLLIDAMKDVVSKGTGTACNFPNMAIAGKTGTTSEYKDIWFSGFTPYYTCTVWGGYDNSVGLEKGKRDYTKTLWKSVMSRIHENLEYRDFTMPDGIEKAVICTKSGKLAVEGLCDQDPRGTVRTEYFAKGTAPTEVCDTHVRAARCAATGLLAADTCPYKEEQVFIVRPEGSQGVTADTPYELPSELCPHGTTAYYPNQIPGAADSILNGITTTPDESEAGTGNEAGTEAGVANTVDNNNNADEPEN